MLSDAEIERYNRQIIVPGIGAAGQEKLLGAVALVVGNARGCAQASLYLNAAGVRTVSATEALGGASFHVAIAAGLESLDAKMIRLLTERARPACWYTVDARGFVAGVASGSLPPAQEPASGRKDSIADCVHDAAACDATAAACAILIGLPHRAGPFRFEV